MAPQPTVVKKKNRRANKKDKGFRLIFDRNKRIDFVTGFKKRKDERRVQAKELEKDEKREARKEILQEKKKQRELVDEQYEQIRMIKRAELGQVSDDDEPEVPKDTPTTHKKETIDAKAGWVWEKQD